MGNYATDAIDSDINDMIDEIFAGNDFIDDDHESYI